MPKTRLESLRSLQSAESHLSKALKKSIIADRRTKRGDASIRKRARKELTKLKKSIRTMKKALGRSKAGKMIKRRFKRTKRRNSTKRKRPKRRNNTKRKRRKRRKRR